MIETDVTRPARRASPRRSRTAASLRRLGGSPGFGVGLATPDYAFAEVSPAIEALALALAERPARSRAVDHAA